MRRPLVPQLAGRALAILGAFLAVVAGVGSTYLLRRVGVLDVGPSVRGALPLQQLAGDENQPLARVVLAWLGSGMAAGLALASFSRATRAAVAFGLSAVVLVAAGAASDSIAISDPLGPHVGPQLTRPGNLVAVLCFVSGSLAARRRRDAPASVPDPAASAR